MAQKVYMFTPYMSPLDFEVTYLNTEYKQTFIYLGLTSQANSLVGWSLSMK